MMQTTRYRERLPGQLSRGLRMIGQALEGRRSVIPRDTLKTFVARAFKQPAATDEIGRANMNRLAEVIKASLPKSTVLDGDVDQLVAETVKLLGHDSHATRSIANSIVFMIKQPREELLAKREISDQVEKFSLRDQRGSGLVIERQNGKLKTLSEYGGYDPVKPSQAHFLHSLDLTRLADDSELKNLIEQRLKLLEQRISLHEMN